MKLGPVRRLLTALRGPERGDHEQHGANVLGSVDYRFGERADPDLAELVEWYRRDNYVKFAVDSVVARIGTKYYLVCEDPEVLRLLDAFLRRNGFVELHLKIARDLVLSGNAFVNTVPAGRITTLHYIPLSSIKRIVTGPDGRPVRYVQHWHGRVAELSAEEVWHFRYNPIDEGAFGEGLVNHLARPGVGYQVKGRSVRRPPFLEIKERVDNAMRILVEKYPPRSVFRVPRAAREAFREAYEQAMIGQDLVVDFDVQQLEVKMDSRTRFYELIDHLDRHVVTGLRNPLIRLITYTGFTYASAMAAIETLEPEIALLRDYLGEQYGRLLEKVLRQHGIDPGPSGVRVLFGEPQAPSWDVRDVIEAARGDERNPPIITVEEARELLRMAGWKLKGSAELEPSRKLYCCYGSIVRELWR
ncbi:MAG: hypothetical protein QXO17_06040 [Nitrososphaerota archaeon]